MSTRAEIVVVRHLHSGISRQYGGGQAREWSRHAAGPRGLREALRYHADERREATVGFGAIGAGGGYLVVVPRGADLDDPRAVRVRWRALDHVPTPPAGASLGWWAEALSRAERLVAAEDAAERAQLEALYAQTEPHYYYPATPEHT